MLALRSKSGCSDVGSRSLSQPASQPSSQSQLYQLMNLIGSVCVLRILTIAHTNNYMFMRGTQQNFDSRLAEPNSHPPGSHR